MAVVSHAFWMRRFGGDPVINRTLNLDGEGYTVVGIAPEHFAFPDGTEVWAPLLVDGDMATTRGSHWLDVFGRLVPDATIDDAQAELSVIAARLETQYPDTNTGESARLMAFVEGIREEGVAPFLMVLLVTTAFVLLIACVNVANMLLARGAVRQKELAVRAAHGTSGRRILRLLLTESVVLSLVGGVAALGVAWLGVELIHDNMPATIARYIPG